VQYGGRLCAVNNVTSEVENFTVTIEYRSLPTGQKLWFTVIGGQERLEMRHRVRYRRAQPHENNVSSLPAASAAMRDDYFRIAAFFSGDDFLGGAGVLREDRRGGLRASLAAFTCVEPHCLTGRDFDGLAALRVAPLTCRS
jgi:hypothetical protein